MYTFHLISFWIRAQHCMTFHLTPKCNNPLKQSLGGQKTTQQCCTFYLLWKDIQHPISWCLKWPHPLPFSSWLYLHMHSNNCNQTLSVVCIHFSLQNCCSSVTFICLWACAACFRSCHISLGVRSGLWLSQKKVNISYGLTIGR